MTRTRTAAVAALAGALVAAGLALADDGKMVFQLKACDTCHSVPTAGIKAKIPSLQGPDLVNLDRQFDVLTLPPYLRQESKLDGTTHPRQLKAHEEELRVLVDWLLAQKSEKGS